MNPIQLTGSSDLPREQADFYITPPHATQALLEKEQFSGTIWECACGDGAISKLLLNLPNTTIISSDLYNHNYGETGVDFLSTRRQVDSVITNPPYYLAQKFVEHALECASDRVAMLLKLNFLEGAKRKGFWLHTPLRKVYVFSRRLSFDRGYTPNKGRGLLAYAWFVWKKGYSGEAGIDWI